MRETGKHGGVGSRQVKEMRRKQWESKKKVIVTEKEERKRKDKNTGYRFPPSVLSPLGFVSADCWLY